MMSKLNLIPAALISLSLVSPGAFAWDADYQENRELVEQADSSITSISIDAGSGFIKLAGTDNKEVRVSAEILLEEGDEAEAKEILEDHMTLTLEKKGSRLVLKSHFDMGFSSGFWGGNNGVIHLTIEVPKNLNVDIEDGSGSITVDGLGAELEINDGSGSITVTNVNGPVKIDDGSGSINLALIQQSVDIEDGSGSITVEDVQGDVAIDDGSGSINVSAIGGSVSVNDGSGGIYVSNVKGDFILVDDGSGSLKVHEIAGQVSLNK